MLPQVQAEGDPIFPKSIIFDKETLLQWISKKPLEITPKVQHRRDNDNVLMKTRPDTRVQKERSKVYAQRQQRVINEMIEKRREKSLEEREFKEKEKERNAALLRALARIRHQRTESTKTSNGRKSRKEAGDLIEIDKKKEERRAQRQWDRWVNDLDDVSQLDDFEDFEVASPEFYIFVENLKSTGSKHPAEQILSDILQPLVENSLTIAKIPLKKIKVKKSPNNNDPADVIVAKVDRHRRLNSFLMRQLDIDAQTSTPCKCSEIFNISGLDSSKVSDRSILRMHLTGKLADFSSMINQQREARRSRSSAYELHQEEIENKRRMEEERERRKDRNKSKN
ncbi:hypothetical protein GEMRC1_012828 [Eukaryota sp. GEM-RC1]